MVEILEWHNNKFCCVKLKYVVKNIKRASVFFHFHDKEKIVFDASVCSGNIVRFLLKKTAKPIQKIALYLVYEDDTIEDFIVLDNFFPANDTEFERNFIREKQRYRVSSIDFFYADQVERFFKGSGFHRCSSSVVKAYKAIELQDDDLAVNACKGVLKSLVEVNKLNLDWHPRKNREHLKFSLMCSLWHLYLFLENHSEFLLVLENIYNECCNKEIDNYFTIAFPISKSLCLYAFYFGNKGDFRKAKDISEICFNVFKMSVRDADIKRKLLFEELSVPHRATSLALRLSTEPQLYNNKKFLKGSFNELVRINGKKFPTVSDDLYQKFNKLIRKDTE